jgi:hypothetical protein
VASIIIVWWSSRLTSFEVAFSSSVKSGTLKWYDNFTHGRLSSLSHTYKRSLLVLSFFLTFFQLLIPKHFNILCNTTNMSDPRSRKRGQDASKAESSRSPSLLEKMMETIQLEEKLNPKLTLKRFLSVRSVVSTSSSFAERQQTAVGTISKHRRIGAGTCGTIFEIPRTALILKVAKHPGKSTDQLWNDFQIHWKVTETFDKIGRENIGVHVPRQESFIGSTDTVWWDSNAHRFPEAHQMVSNVLCAERILPLLKPIRESLVEQYCPEAGKATAKASESNKDCLVRLYLGKRRERPNNRFFQLRNFNLHLNQMEDLELEILEFCDIIADGLALMHWGVEIDANDVEFVLGSAPDQILSSAPIKNKSFAAAQISKMKPNTSTWAAHHNDFKRRHTHIWLLDFNKCATFLKTRPGLEQLVQAFYINDPYYPRLHSNLLKDLLL